MIVLACRLGINGLLNPEDDPWDGAKEEWYVSAENAAHPDWEAADGHSLSEDTP